MHINTDTIAQAASRATELGLGEATAARFIDDFVAGHSLGAAEVRAQVAAITALPEANARPAAALRLALSAEPIDPDEAAAQLAALPVEIAPRATPSAALPTIPTLAERARSMPEIGAALPPLSRKEAKEEATKASWARTVARVNENR